MVTMHTHSPNPTYAASPRVSISRRSHIRIAHLWRPLLTTNGLGCMELGA